MGKGDRKSKKGKIFMGSYGNTRRRKKKNRKFVVQKKVAPTTHQAVAPVPVEPIVAETAEVTKLKVKKTVPKKKAAEKKEKPAAKKSSKKKAEK